MYDVSSEVQVVEQAVEVSVADQAQAQSTSSSSYTVTKTVRNVVTDDTSINGVAASSEEYAPLPENAGGYAPANNPYDMPYEEEDTTTTTTSS